MNHLSKTVCERDTCTGCNACVNKCAKNAITIVDSLTTLNAFIDENKCVRCGACSRVCQNNVDVDFQAPIAWFQGWNNNGELRLNSSSGGFIASAVYHFLENGMSVYSCVFHKGTFIFRRVENKNDFTSFSGSKYVKSNTGRIFNDILMKLNTGNKVLFIGLPCQVEGLKLFVGKAHWDSLYTIDLICHGTPSSELYKTYLGERGYDVSRINHISFRNKNKYSKKRTNGYQYWLSPFLNGLTYTENCYNCRFARMERVSDITVGDSWGSSLPTEELNRGVSLVLCNTKKGLQLMESVDFYKVEVDPVKASARNEQLVHSMSIPKERTIFAQKLNSSGYHKAIRACYGKQIARFSIGKTFVGKAAKHFLHRHESGQKVDISFSEYISLK